MTEHTTPLGAGKPNFLRAADSVKHKSTAYRAAVAAGEIDTEGNPLEAPKDGLPIYDGHGRVIGRRPA
jgi:hypothetical protein